MQQVSIKTAIVVIGAGQAGLATAYHLKRRGLAPVRGFLVLDQAPHPGGAWQFRWPSLKLSTLNRIHDLPGMERSTAPSPCRWCAIAATGCALKPIAASSRRAAS
jgi:cation diffusion facilitator CzcD-associated flavoprotein CzcO